jgi:hypothetical protein
LHRSKRLRHLGLFIFRGIDDDRHEKGFAVRHVVSAIDRKFPLTPEVTFQACLPPLNHEKGVAALASFLYAGVTPVFDAGNRAEHILPLRAEERAGKILSPRIFATGNLVTYPGSHGDMIAVRISDFEKDKALLDKHINEQQPDMLKLTLEEEDWGSRPMIPLMPVDLLEKITRYYNQHAIRTTVHVSSELRSLEAIYAGVDTLAHPVIQGPVSDSFMKLMGAKKIPFASTLTIGENYSRLAEHPEYLDQPLYVASISAAEREQLKSRTRAEWQARPWTWTDADTTAVRDGDGSIVEGILKVAQGFVRVRRGLVEFSRIFHVERLVRPFMVVALG